MAPRAAVASPFLFAALAVLVAPAVAEVRVQVAGSSVDLAATAAPLAEVLDRLSRQIGMKVVYEGAAPRQLVTVTVRGRTPAQTVLAVLEGQGVNYALVTDPTGSSVRTLLVTGAASSSGGSAPARAVPAPANRPPFGLPPGAGADAEPPFEEGDEEQPEEPVSFGVPPGVEGIEQPQPPENVPPVSPGRTPRPARTRPPRTRDRWRRRSGSRCRRSRRSRQLRRPCRQPLPCRYPARAARPVRLRRSSGRARSGPRDRIAAGSIGPEETASAEGAVAPAEEEPAAVARPARPQGRERLAPPGPDDVPGGRTPPPGCGTAGPTGRPITRGWPGRNSHSL